MAILTARPTPAGRMNRPDKGISAPFGYSPQYFSGKVMHHGQDYYWLNADPAGSRKVYSAGAGVVKRVYWDDTMGGCIEITIGEIMVRHCHMPKNSSLVKAGQAVTDQTYLGPMGNAGTAANGAYHHHFEVWKNGVRVDPEPYFRELKPTERQVLLIASANKRLTASKSGELRGSFPAGSVVNFEGYVRGEAVNGVDVWGVVGGFYSWLGGFIDSGTHDLPDLTPLPEPPAEEPGAEPGDEPEPEPEPDPEPVPEPVEPEDNWLQALFEIVVKMSKALVRYFRKVVAFLKGKCHGTSK